MLDPSFFSYVTVMSITPGPNNMLLATSGVNFGLKRTIPLLSGIILGFALQTVVLSALLEQLLNWMEAIRLPLTVLGCLYLVWLSVKIYRCCAPDLQERSQPMGLKGAIAFQLLNPKGWLMVSNIALLYSTQNTLLTVTVAFILLNFPCIFLWALMGDRLGALLQDPIKRKIFNGLMALSLLVTALWMLVEVMPLGSS